MGGEKRLGGLSWPCVAGSPPRGRGKGSLTFHVLCIMGITPAWAGKSYKYPAGLLPTWDHPRVGGEKSSHASGCPCGVGSPPRGRGKVFPCRCCAAGFGITPAWAGKRPAGSNPDDQNGDHPRVGGEKVQILLYEDIQKGSPPRGRGKGGEKLPKRTSLGITPAWAGKRHHIAYLSF